MKVQFRTPLKYCYCLILIILCWTNIRRFKRKTKIKGRLIGDEVEQLPIKIKLNSLYC